MNFSSHTDASVPLAERMRPQTLDKFVGQDHLLGKGKLLWQLVRKRQLPSILLWGPPGCGKTTLARILARESGAEFVFFSAVLAGVKEIREIVDGAKGKKLKEKAQTVLFVDEIHRFNKGQQDAFLPHVESGLITLIGATTENPSFQIIAPLLSRCRVLVLNPLTEKELRTVLESALEDPDRGFGRQKIIIEENALQHLISIADGDARRALTSLEIAVSLAKTAEDEESLHIDLDTVTEALQRHTLRYDMAGEEHYNLISALHKSLRDSDPDGALYWLCRMLAAGEDPLYLARRMIRFASEDIGIADPHALTLAINARGSYHMLGSPEGELALAEAAIYLATAPKSNAVYTAFQKVMQDIKKTGSLSVPLHLRNAPTRLMKELDYGKGYQYAHDAPQALVNQQHLPDQLADSRYYYPTTRGYEAVVSERLDKWRRILKSRAGQLNKPPEKPSKD